MRKLEYRCANKRKLRESGYINIVKGKVSVKLEMYKLLLNSLKELN